MSVDHVPILKLGACLIAAVQDELTDTGWQNFQEDLLSRAGNNRSKGVIIDVSAMDVMDSYATRVLDGIARMLLLRGAQTVIVGLQAEVAFSMAQLGLRLASAGTALDLDEGLLEINRRIKHGS
ncbi:MAG: STAS domain-containing protein [Pseudomonadota bacterium]|nr:STAS domain-containing protein [Pseudomonadota bacterium]